MENNKPLIGVITSRTCPTCGHHEIGYATDTGEFHPLRPGDMVEVFPKAHSSGLMENERNISIIDEESRKEKAFGSVPWLPDPLRCHGSLRCKYGILTDRVVSDENMSPEMYEMIYRQKLQKLIEGEIFTPVSVILDRYFAAPHLASGDAKQVADAMWEELEEIRRPVENVGEWLQKRDTESLKKMIHPVSIRELAGEPVCDEQLTQELERISLEDFLEMA